MVPRLSIACSVVAALLSLKSLSAQQPPQGLPEVYVSILCAAANPDGTRERPFPTVGAALAYVRDPNHQASHKVILLPNDPASPYVIGTVDVPGKAVEICSEGGPSVTSSGGIAVAANNVVTITGIYISTPAGTGIFAATGSSLFVRNCVFHNCLTGISTWGQTGTTVAVRNCVFFGCNDAVLLRINGTNSFTSCIFARQQRYVVGFDGCGTGNVPVVLDHYAFCENATPISNCNGFIAPRNQLPCPPPGGTIFVDPNRANFQLDCDSGLFHTGSPARQHQNPDGTRNTPGAFGGPQAIPYESRAVQLNAAITSVDVAKTSPTNPDQLQVRVRVRVEE